MSIHQHPDYPNLFEARHPLVLHKLTLLRETTTTTKEFKALVHEITLLLVYEVTRDLPLKTREITTPICHFHAPTLADAKNPVILPILRAGIGMVDAFLSLMPTAKVGHVGLFRNEVSLEPELYYFKIPSAEANRKFYVCDPMLATGGSACQTIQLLKQRDITDIAFVCLVAAPEGVTRFSAAHPDIPIFCASLDNTLNDHGYIVPGLGDAGDRLFGTK